METRRSRQQQFKHQKPLQTKQITQILRD